MRAHSLEDLQDQYSTYRRRAEPGLTRDDIVAAMAVAIESLETGIHHGRTVEEWLGELLIDLCCLAQVESLDLAHHARQAFRRMQQEYEASQ